MRLSIDQARALVAEFQTSGLSQAAFCREKGLRKQRLSYWRQRLAEQSATDEPAAQGFVAIEMQPTSSGNGMWRVVVADGVEVWCPCQPAVAWLRALASGVAAHPGQPC